METNLHVSRASLRIWKTCPSHPGNVARGLRALWEIFHFLTKTP